MLFTFAVLSSVVAFAAAQGSVGIYSPLPDSTEALQYINEANNENMIWDESLAQSAEKWLIRPRVKADKTIVGKKCFPKSDKMSWFDKTIVAFEQQINEQQNEIDKLGTAPIFGCSGLLDPTLEMYDCLNFVCLYRKQ